MLFLFRNLSNLFRSINIIAGNLVKTMKEAEDLAYQEAPMGVLIYDENERFMWSNHYLLEMVKVEDPIGYKLLDLESNLINLIKSDKEWKVLEVNHKMYKAYHQADKRTLYFMDIDREYRMEKVAHNHEMVFGYLLLDDYDEVIQSMNDQEFATFEAGLLNRLTDWTQKYDVYLKRVEENKFILLFTRVSLNSLEKNEFSDLEAIKQFYYDANIPISISIGIAYLEDGKNAVDILSKNAQNNLDLALGRGGNQVVVKDGEGPARFYGGNNSLIERTNTRSKLVYQALIHQIDQASNVLISGHKTPDLDSMASALGVYKLVTEHKKVAKIIVDETGFNSDIINLLSSPQISYNLKNIFVDKEKSSEYVSSKTLIILVDHHRPSLSEAENLLVGGQSVVIIDHHRRGEEFPSNTVLTYIETSASSTSELITEFFMNQRNTNEALNHFESTALMAGIIVDTNNFSARTGSKTFDAASYLKSRGADMSQIQRILKEDLDLIKARNELIERTKVYQTKFAIAFGKEDQIIDNVTAAQAADEMLSLSEIEASFVVFRRTSDMIGISARSLGKINVQRVMENLGGGGHLSNAATQIADITIEDGIEMLKNSIDEILGG